MSFSDEIFSMVEATINPEWKEQHESSFYDVLNDVREATGVVIQLENRSYVIRGSLSQIVEANQKLALCGIDADASTESGGAHEDAATVIGASLPAFKSTGSGDLTTSVHHPLRASSLNNAQVPVSSSRQELCSVSIAAGAADDAASVQTTANSVHLSAPDALHVSGPSREIYADSDIWEYIEAMKKDQLRAINDLGIAIQRVNENGITRVVICSEEPATTSFDVLNVAHDLLIELYEVTVTNCVVEKYTCVIDEQVAFLRLEETNQQFRDVLARKCEYDDNFYFIGSRTEAYQAKQFFSRLVASAAAGRNRPRKFDTQRGQGHSLPYQSMPYIDNLSLANAAKPNQSKNSGRLGDVESPYSSVAGQGLSRAMSDDEDLVSTVSDNMDSPAARVEPAPCLDRAREKSEDSVRSVNNDRVDKDRGDRCRHGDDDGDDDNRRGGNSRVSIGDLLDDGAVNTAGERNSTAQGDSKVSPKQWNVGANCSGPDGARDRPMRDAEHRMIYSRDDLPARKTLIDASGVTVHSINCLDAADDAGFARDDRDRLDEEKQSKRKVKVTRRPMPKPSAAVGDPGVERHAGAEADAPAAAVIDDIGNDEFQAAVLMERQARADLAPKSKQSDENWCKTFGTSFAADSRKGSFIGKPSRRMPFDSDSSDDEQPRSAAMASRVNAAATMVHRPVPAKACGVLFGHRVQVVPAAKMKRDFACVQSGRQRTDDWFVPSQAGSTGVGDELTARIDSLLAEGNPEALDELLNAIGGNVQNSLPAVGSVSRAVVDGKDEEASDNSDDDDKLETSAKPPQPPDGTFTQLVDKKVHLAGFEGFGTIMITIRFDAGVEESHPRKSYTQFDCNAYLPANADGKRVCQLMEKAFNANKLFRVQYPGDAEIGSIVPNDVTFKTDSNSYPDVSYLNEVKGQLETLLGCDADID